MPAGFGHALIDRQLYLLKAWAKDDARRGAAGIPAEVAFATKPALARQMLAEALDSGLPCAWVLADAVDGSDHQTR